VGLGGLVRPYFSRERRYSSYVLNIFSKARLASTCHMPAKEGAGQDKTDPGKNRQSKQNDLENRLAAIAGSRGGY